VSLLTDYGWHDRVAALWSLLDEPQRQPGRVARVDRGSLLVVTAGGITRSRAHALASRRAGLDVTPVTGDWVAVADDADEGLVVVAVAPRWSQLSREDPDPRATTEQVLAANVDVAAVVTPLDRPVAPNRVERTLAAVWDAGAVPVVVLTKCDLDVDVAAAVREVERAAAGAEVVVTSAETGVGVEAVRALAGGRSTLALLGPSGAGKSSLANRVVDADVLATGRVRSSDHRGRHTTAARELVPVPGGGVLLDTPGLRSLGLWDAAEGVASSFGDVEDLAGACRFRDCRHDGEPGCAVAAAVEDGRLDRRRLASYVKLQRELASLDHRRDERARRAAGKHLSRQQRLHERLDPGRWRRDR
jgi:ribosome biogenesis GTPase / thiamine phosphate phosphatase